MSLLRTSARIFRLLLSGEISSYDPDFITAPPPLLTDVVFESPYFSVRLPSGWYIVTGDGESQLVDLLLGKKSVLKGHYIRTDLASRSTPEQTFSSVFFPATARLATASDYVPRFPTFLVDPSDADYSLLADASPPSGYPEGGNDVSLPCVCSYLPSDSACVTPIILFPTLS